MLTSKAAQEVSAVVTPCLFIVDLHLHHRVAPSPLDCWLSVRPPSRITSAAWGQPRSWGREALNCRLLRKASCGQPRSMLASVTSSLPAIFAASCKAALLGGSWSSGGPPEKCHNFRSQPGAARDYGPWAGCAEGTGRVYLHTHPHRDLSNKTYIPHHDALSTRKAVVISRASDVRYRGTTVEDAI